MDEETLLIKLEELDLRKRILQKKRNRLGDRDCSYLLDRLISKTHKTKNKIARQLRKLHNEKEP